MTLCLTSAGPSGAVGTKSGPLGPSEDLRGKHVPVLLAQLGQEGPTRRVADEVKNTTELGKENLKE